VLCRRIYIYDGNGSQMGTDSMNATPIQSPLTYTAAANPGKKVTYKYAHHRTLTPQTQRLAHNSNGALA
jgi:hypothetical protein